MNIAKYMRVDGSALMVLSGEFDLASADEVRALGLDLIAAAGCTRLLVDLMDVSFMDSTGIGALVAVRNAAIAADTPMALLDPSERVLKVLGIARLVDVFVIERSSHQP